jgi:hypothetical protein
MHRYWDFDMDRVGLRVRDLYMDWVRCWNFLFDNYGIRFWYMNSVRLWYRDFYFNWVRDSLLYCDMNWVWLVDWDLDSVRHGFVYGVRDRLMDGYRNWIGTINRDFDRIWNWFLYWVRNMLFHWYVHWIRLRHWYFLGQGDCLDGLMVYSVSVATKDAIVQPVAKTCTVPKVVDKASLLLLPVALFYFLSLLCLFRFFGSLLIAVFFFILFRCLFFFF